MTPSAAFWSAKRVLVTGHTGFKGGWLTLWLASLGAEVTGAALPPEDIPNLFETGAIGSHCHSNFVDIRDQQGLKRVVDECDPEIVFHLAAQPLVLRSYEEPLATWQTNVMGTLHLLEILRARKQPCSVVVVTSDKCYANDGGEPADFCEGDPLGGHDPYSSSKAAVEIAVNSWRQSFFDGRLGLASARAGNVIGGGDWARDRLVPDLVRALNEKQHLVLRNADAVRPWQHVLEPLCGYLQLAESLTRDARSYSGPWNFGPSSEAILTVRQVVELAAQSHRDLKWSLAEDSSQHEAHALSLDSSKARAGLHWAPRWTAAEAIAVTLAWYDALRAGTNASELCLDQISTYAATAQIPVDVPEEVTDGA